MNCLTNIVVSCCFPVFGSHLRIRVAVWAGLLLAGMPDRKEAAAPVGHCGTAFRQERLKQDSHEGTLQRMDLK